MAEETIPLPEGSLVMGGWSSLSRCLYILFGVEQLCATSINESSWSLFYFRIAVLFSFSSMNESLCTKFFRCALSLSLFFSMLKRWSFNLRMSSLVASSRAPGEKKKKDNGFTRAWQKNKKSPDWWRGYNQRITESKETRKWEKQRGVSFIQCARQLGWQNTAIWKRWACEVINHSYLPRIAPERRSANTHTHTHIDSQMNASKRK